MGWLEDAPLPAIGFVVFAILIVTHEAALRLARRMVGKKPHQEVRAYLVSSALGLLALLMGFTFSAAQDRYEQRQDLVVGEANALGTAFLRTQLLDPPWRQVLGEDLFHYGQTRQAFSEAISPDEIERNGADGALLQAKIWRDLGAALQVSRSAAVDLGLVQAFNEMFDLAASRRAARENRVPLTVIRSMILSSIAVAAIVGYSEGADGRETSVMFGVLLLLTLVFVLILDLDRPTTGRIRISEAPMDRAVREIRAAQAAQARSPPPTPQRPTQAGPAVSGKPAARP
jgi:hypothetical protein